MKKIKAAVFASGTGSNFEAMMERDDLLCDVVLLVCDKTGASVIDKAVKFGVPVLEFDPKEYASKKEYETMLISRLRDAEVEWIFLAGYMRIVGRTLLDAYTERIVNIHPSLLPAFPGKDAINQVFHAGVEVTGVTVHFIDEGIDTGPIISQESVTVYADDTEQTLKTRIQEVEHKLYPDTINHLLRE
ncbi:phosphoribosylglycinamide formyltransferase [Virgibacillus doumboii]|uniref:phosphoribosylglycinamide formyltransferase n=1 Tax=Virgibacillus doumboii TaxID=2697503 RepID=UPI0013DEE724|nr:phosphoribosylglycinamide formyltransferase [Virgibacillus doumboii]